VRLAHESEQDQAQDDRQPQRLTEQRTDLAAAVGAVELGNERRHHHQQADQDQDHQRPDRAADTHCGQGQRTMTAGQQGVDHVHRHRRGLADDHRHRQKQTGAYFASQAREECLR